MAATPCSTAPRRSIAARAAPAPRRAWRSSPRAATSASATTFVHESIIGSLFEGRVEGTARVGEHPAIVPSVAGWARLTGLNTIFVDPRDPYAHGFQLG